MPSAIDGELLKLVHLLNGFWIVDGAKPLQARDVCQAEAHIVFVTNANKGKIIKVKGYVCCEGVKVIEVVSSFLYHGHFLNFENTFKMFEECDYIMPFTTNVDVGVMQSKEWFHWDHSKPLSAGTSLIFCIHFQVSFKDQNSYQNVSVSGEIFIQNQLKVLIQIRSIKFQQDNSHGNPILAYLQHHGSAEGVITPLSGDGYDLVKNEESTSFNAPFTNELYSQISGDFIPIHVNPYFANYTSLPTTITHGLWSSTATHRCIKNVVVQGHPDHIFAYVIFHFSCAGFLIIVFVVIICVW